MGNTNDKPTVIPKVTPKPEPIVEQSANDILRDKIARFIRDNHVHDLNLEANFLIDNLKLNQDLILNFKYDGFGYRSLIPSLIDINNVLYFEYIMTNINLVKYKKTQDIYTCLHEYTFACKNNLHGVCRLMLEADYLHGYEVTTSDNSCGEGKLLTMFKMTYDNQFFDVCKLIIDKYTEFKIHPSYHSLFFHFHCDAFAKYICYLSDEDTILSYIQRKNNFDNLSETLYLEILLSNALSRKFNTVLEYIFENIAESHQISRKNIDEDCLFDLHRYKPEYFEKYWKLVVINYKKDSKYIYPLVRDFLQKLCVNEEIKLINLVLDTINIHEVDKIDLYKNHSNNIVQKIFIDRYELNDDAFLIKKYGINKVQV